MKIRYVFLMGLFVAIMAILVMSNEAENGDGNAIAMYFVVFLMPVIFCLLINALYLKYLQHSKFKFIFSIIPFIIFLCLSFLKEIPVPFFDANFVFATKILAIAIGVSNTFWIVSQLKTS